MRPKLLLLITEDWAFWSHRLPIARAALQSGYEVLIATRVSTYGQKIAEEGFRLVPLPLSRENYSPFRELRTIHEIKGIYRRERPNIVHHVALKPILYGSLAALGQKNIKVVNALAGLGYMVASSSVKARLFRLIIWSVFRFLLSRPNSKILLQNQEDQEFSRTRLGVPGEKTTIIRGS